MNKLTQTFYKFLHAENTQDWIVIGIDAAIFVVKVVVFCLYLTPCASTIGGGSNVR